MADICILYMYISIDVYSYLLQDHGGNLLGRKGAPLASPRLGVQLHHRLAGRTLLNL